MLGLSHLLEQEGLTDADVAKAIQPTSAPKLDVLTSGANPINPGELLTGNNLARILCYGGAHYDRIVCDAPPVLAVSDCAILSRLLDGVLMVVRADKSDRVRVARAHDVLRSMNCPLLGIVVNRVDRSNAYGAAYYGLSEYEYAYAGDQKDGVQGEGQAPLPAA
jgi:capsular exopolysaccharide synthesis family protein